MTYAEARDWASYIRSHGTLHTGRRLEYHFAVLCSMINRALGGKMDMKDFMPHYREDDHEIDLETAMERWA